MCLYVSGCFKGRRAISLSMQDCSLRKELLRVIKFESNVDVVNSSLHVCRW